MFIFFSHSYRQWCLKYGAGLAQSNDFDNLELGRWLKDTKLFKEAWGSVVETPARVWWSQQIFFSAAGWSVFLERESG